MKLRILVAVTASVALSAPEALADTQYGGSALNKGRPSSSISLLQRDNGTITGRVVFGFGCKNTYISNAVTRVRGRLNGAAFTATGSNRMRSGRLRITMRGTVVTGDAVTGTLRVRLRGCISSTRPFVLKSGVAPGGPPAKPAPGSLFHGLTSQSAGGVQLPVSIRIANNGRMYALWQATVKCGNVPFPVLDVTPTRPVGADGTFSNTQTYTIRYSGSPDERYRVTFRGQFVAGGAIGTLSARLLFRQRGQRYRPCLSGTQTWTARP